MPVELSRLHVGEHAAAGEEAHAFGRFEREAGAAAGDGVDDQLGVRPILELGGTDIEGQPAISPRWTSCRPTRNSPIG